MEGIFDVATRVSTPLTLAGFIPAAFFLIARQVIKANLFPKLTREMSADILRDGKMYSRDIYLGVYSRDEETDRLTR